MIWCIESPSTMFLENKIETIKLKNNNMKFNFRKKQNSLLALLILVLSGMSLSLNAGAQGNDKTILGAGSTFVYPLFSKMFYEYNKNTGIQVNYQSIGSGGGILQLTNKTVDFGDSDG